MPSCSSSAHAHCHEAGPGSKAAAPARSWASPSPAEWHSGAMPKEQCCRDRSRDGAHSPGRKELPLSQASLILVARSLHQLLFRRLCTVLPDTSHSTHVTQGFLAVILPSALDLKNYPVTMTWPPEQLAGEKKKMAHKLMEVCHFCSRSLTYISFAANALQHLRGVICVNILKGTFFFLMLTHC